LPGVQRTAIGSKEREMKLGAVFLSVLLLGAAIAQDAPPVPPPDKVVPTCRGTDSDPPGCLTPPKLTYSPDPVYPEKERKSGHEGTVVLSVVVGRDGSPRDVKVSRTLGREFDQAAIDAVESWRFSPGTKNGKPVATRINVQVSFRIYGRL
jgi:periplasmic protein TonB